MKHGYKRAIAMLLAATVMTGLTACGGGSSSGGGSGSASGGSGDGTFTASGKTLNVGVQSNIISIPTVYAEEKGYFDDLGLDVNLIMFPNGSPENEGLAAEQLDVASNGLASVYSTASGLCDWIAESDSGSKGLRSFGQSGARSQGRDFRQAGYVWQRRYPEGSDRSRSYLHDGAMDCKLVLCTVWPDCRFGLRISEHGSRSSRTGDSDR